MNASAWKAAWASLPPARKARLKRRQSGFAMYESGRRPGLPAPVANAHARFEYQARLAMRDWLML